MRIKIVLKSSFLRLTGIWRGALVVWFSSLLLVSLFAIPMKGVLKSGFGRSMIEDKLRDGFNVEVFSDLGDTLSSLGSYFSSGFILIIITGFLMNAFFAGGFYDGMKHGAGKSSTGDFLRSSAKNFWSFLVISCVMSLMIVVLAALVIALPIVVVGKAIIMSEGSIFKTGIILTSLFLLMMVILILVSDYARAWQATRGGILCFRAIGFGFRQTFRTILISYTLMLTLLTVQILFSWLLLKILPGWTPDTGVGVGLLFVLSQLLFLIKVMLKVWRYGCIIALMEVNLDVKSVSD